MVPTIDLFERFGTALAIGLLIGVEREREPRGKFAGVRTFPLIALAGCLSALLGETGSPWLFPVAFAVVGAFILRSYILTGEPERPGITTEMSALLTFLLGGATWWGEGRLAAALAVVAVLLLASKEPMERWALRIGHADIVAAVQFGVITLIVLPLLPNRAFGPLHVLNPHQIWLMVVFIAAVNLVGYALVRIFGTHQGYAATGLLGGLVSSTAVALGLSRRARQDPALAQPLALAIAIASTIMFLRMLAIALALNPAVGRWLALPALAATVLGLMACRVIEWRGGRAPMDDRTQAVPMRSPFELWPALQFGVLFAAMLFLARAGAVYLGREGVYLSSALSGLADVDAITVSLTSLATGGTIDPRLAAQGVLLAAAANTVVKGGLVLVLGSRGLRRAALPAFGLMLAAALAGAWWI